MSTSVHVSESMRREVEWYLRNGAHGRERIARTKDGEEYVIGDWSWNRETGRSVEFIELRMTADLRQS